LGDSFGTLSGETPPALVQFLAMAEGVDPALQRQDPAMPRAFPELKKALFQGLASGQK
jgi:hypothetical protein